MMTGMKSINYYFNLLQGGISVAENVTSKWEENIKALNEIAWQMPFTPDVKVLKTRGC